MTAPSKGLRAKFRHFPWRVRFVLAALFVGLVLCTFGFNAYLRHLDRIDDATEAVAHIAAVYAELADTLPRRGAGDVLVELGDRLATVSPGARLTLLDRGGKPVFDITPSSAGSGQPGVVSPSSLADDHVSARVPLSQGDGYLLLDLPTAVLLGERTSRMRDALVFCGLFTFAGVFLIWHVVGRSMLPIKRLTRAVRRVNAGNLHFNCDFDSDPEVLELTTAFRRTTNGLRQSLKRIHELAYVDMVTHLGNRELFRREVTRALGANEAVGGTILYIDLDRFKKINDTFGYDRGDAVLWAFANRVRGAFDIVDITAMVTPTYKPSNTTSRTLAARIGGDEFAMYFHGLANIETADRQASKVLELLAAPFDVEGSQIHLGGSIGVARWPEHGRDFQTLMRHADIAMYRAKAGGRNAACHFLPSMEMVATNTLAIETAMHRAIENGELEVYYQPKVACGRSVVMGAEALIRWRHPERGLIEPGNFIPLAEQNGMILDIGKWVLDEVCRQAVEWQAAGFSIPVAVNMSALQLERSDFVDSVGGAIDASGLDSMLLEIELTESISVTDTTQLAPKFRQLKERGVRFALDDVGTGHSCLATISRLPFDVFKIDRSFVAGIGHSHDAEVVVRTILAMAEHMGCEAVAEGVETEQQAAFMTRHGCTLAQGYLFARPMPAEDFIDYVRVANKAMPVHAAQDRLKTVFSAS